MQSRDPYEFLIRTSYIMLAVSITGYARCTDSANYKTERTYYKLGIPEILVTRIHLAPRSLTRFVYHDP